jgi:hypothetical protein
MPRRAACHEDEGGKSGDPLFNRIKEGNKGQTKQINKQDHTSNGDQHTGQMFHLYHPRCGALFIQNHKLQKVIIKYKYSAFPTFLSKFFFRRAQ